MFGRLLGRLLLMPASRETQKAVEKEFRALEPLPPLAAKNKDMMRDTIQEFLCKKKDLSLARARRKSEILQTTPKGRKESFLGIPTYRVPR